MTGPVKITVLCENTVFESMGITGEHGFSTLVQKDGLALLFDTGQGMSLANNARTLGINLSKIQTVVLSHGHYDHTGGLPAVLSRSHGVEIIAHPDLFTEKFAERDTSEGKKTVFIGMKYSREYLEERFGVRFRLIRQYTEIYPGIHFSGEVPRQTAFEHPDRGLKVKRHGKMVQDPLLDDASLLIETEKGPVLLLGCAHAGVVNVMHHFASETGHRHFHAVIGGTHLGPLSRLNEDQLERSMNAFDTYDVDLIAVSHCTGQRASAVCYHRFKDRFAFAGAGWHVTF